jgi:large subunit ribosomal protein L32e
MDLIKLRRKQKRKKPSFVRQGGRNLKRLGEKWRAPRGSQSKLRKHKKARGFIPHPGYSSPKEVRGLHPSGLKEVLVYNVNDLNKIKENQAARIGKSVGRKKRIEMINKSKEMKIKVLNPQRSEPKKVKKPKPEVKKEVKKEKVEEKPKEKPKEEVKKEPKEEKVEEIKKEQPKVKK